MSSRVSFTQYSLSAHAREEMRRRRIAESDVADVLSAPEQAERARENRWVLQSRIVSEEGRTYLLRVFVDIDREQPVVVTVYRTSKIEKYWRKL